MLASGRGGGSHGQSPGDIRLFAKSRDGVVDGRRLRGECYLEG